MVFLFSLAVCAHHMQLQHYILKLRQINTSLRRLTRRKREGQTSARAFLRSSLEICSYAAFPARYVALREIDLKSFTCTDANRKSARAGPPCHKIIDENLLMERNLQNEYIIRERNVAARHYGSRFNRSSTGFNRTENMVTLSHWFIKECLVRDRISKPASISFTSDFLPAAIERVSSDCTRLTINYIKYENVLISRGVTREMCGCDKRI